MHDWFKEIEKAITVSVVALMMLPSFCSSQTGDPTIPFVEGLQGSWVGALEYRDYSEPASSTKREVLPTWLTISGATWHYIYDDGPRKIIDETDIVHFDSATSTYSESDNGKPAQISKVNGYQRLNDGHGTLLLYSSGTDNGNPSEHRTTITVDRNYLFILEEVRPANATEAFTFRHSLRFTRATAPALSTKH